MKLDIILITYNQEQYIAQAVESVLMQRVDDDVQVRVIVADDCSKDKTLEIIKSYEVKSPFPFLYLAADTNLGISKNYQRAFAVCDGDYIAILEGDDYWSSPIHLKQHYDFLYTHKKCSMSMNSITFLQQHNNYQYKPKWLYKKDIHFVDLKEQIVNGNQLGNLSACVFRTSCLKTLPPSLFDLYIADWMLGVMLAQQGLIALFEQSTSVYRVNAQSQWASLATKDKIQLQLDLADVYDKYQNGLYHKYWSKFKKRIVKNKNTHSKSNILQQLYRKFKSILKHR